MTHTAHTPGQWVATKPYDHSDGGRDNHRNPPSLPDVYTRVEVPANVGIFVTGENQEANARLIAAAPELLAALENIQQELELGEPCMVEQINRISFNAIAKARGQQ